MDRVSTLIIGGGISGLACARRLHEAGHPFLLITDRLGGRMYRSPDGSVNLGATYINEDYRHVGRYVDRGIPYCLSHSYAENDGQLTTLLNWRNLRHARVVMNLLLRLRELRRAVRSFRRHAACIPQRDLLVHYPLIAKYARQSAPELIQELRLGPMHDRYFTLAFQATCFVDPAHVNALFYLESLFPLINRTWMADFSHTMDRLTAGFRDRIRIDSVTALTRGPDGCWTVSTLGSGAYRADNVVIATPYHNAQAFHPIPKPFLSTPATMLAVRGERQPLYRGKRFLLMHPEQIGVVLVWRQRGGTDLVFCTRPGPNLTALYSRPEVTARVTWKTAIVISDGNWAPLQLEPGLYLASDYNLCGLEDSFLTGLCAANNILHRNPAGMKRHA